MKGTREKTILCAGLAALAGVALAGRPLCIDDADPVDAGQAEFEGGAAFLGDGDCDHWDFPFGLTVGLLNGVEAGIGFGGQFEERTEMIEDGARRDHRHESGIGDLALGAKWQCFGGSSAWPRLALAPSVKFPTADEDKGLGSGETDYDLTAIASWALGEKLGAHLNAGYSWIGEPSDESAGDLLHYGAAFDYQVAETVQAVGEVAAEHEQIHGADTAAQATLGLRWRPRDAVTFDVAVGTKIAGAAPDFMATAGFTMAFGISGFKP